MVDVDAMRVINDLSAQLATALRDLAVAKEQIRAMTEAETANKESAKPLSDEPPF